MNLSPPTRAPHSERAVWRGLDGEWRPMFGGFRQHGVSVERHRFRTDRELDWGRSFHPDSLEICLNFQGKARLGVAGGGPEAALGVRTLAVYSPANGDPVRLTGTRGPGATHHFVTVEMSRGFLAEQLAHASPGALRPPVRAFLEAPEEDDGGGRVAPVFVEAEPMNVAVQNAARALAEPPLPADSDGGRLWYRAKVAELIALLLFSPAEAVAPTAANAPELFCARQKRLARERVEAARALLERDLENPPTLEMLARAVGGGAFHLSRTFSQHTGQTIPQYVRELRLERAARMLREGRANVSAAALAVGYQSLSHFSKAFWERFGCCPGLYANPRLAAATTTTRRLRSARTGG